MHGMMMLMLCRSGGSDFCRTQHNVRTLVLTTLFTSDWMVSVGGGEEEEDEVEGPMKIHGESLVFALKAHGSISICIASVDEEFLKLLHFTLSFLLLHPSLLPFSSIVQ